jgi:protein TonB
MRAISSAASISIHAAVAVVLLHGTTKAARTNPVAIETLMVLPEPISRTAESRAGHVDVPIPRVDWSSDLGSILIPSLPQTGVTVESLVSPGGFRGEMPGSDHAPGWMPWRNEQSAEILTAPLPTYPELLRQAGLAGKVVLEAVVDTTGRVLAQSITLVSATHPGFVEPARQALLQTLFRPAMADGKPVRLRVRIPYDFTIRNGIGRAR